MSKLFTKRLLKFLHSMGAIGLTGAVAIYIILLSTAPPPTSLAEYAVLRHGIERVCTLLLLPSLMICLTSGLLAMAVHPPFMNQRWVWVKALLGLSMFEGTLGGVQGPAERAAKVTARAMNGEIDPAVVATLAKDEWGTLWFILVMCVVNVAVAIWRPRLKSRTDLARDRASRTPAAER